MPREHQYFVYILTNWRDSVFYTGVTNDLERRVYEHREGVNKGFTKKYNCYKLIYFEKHSHIDEAIRREKLIKRYKRDWKKNLVESINPEWKDLAQGWYD
jgi:putative endonuclease